MEQILDEARHMESLGALGFCLVTAQKGLDDKTLEFVCTIAHTLKKELPRLRLIACNGTASVEQLSELKKSGIGAYNHNLETSREFYPHVCTTHSWKERYETCENVNTAGLNLLCGGIFGMGETHEDRLSMLYSLKSLNPISVPLNFYHHNAALPLTPSSLTIDESLNLIRLARTIIDKADRIMVAGGREITFRERQHEIFEAGANSIVIGNYLTTAGRDAHADLLMLKTLGYPIVDVL
jgi:biotin synthase